ncbi:GvpL/GvpF family gas vesicle protein [Streptomyces sp. NPDC012769]|uniref:GvpL/GvpF family gas vesicle protein n=1 Tax=Streptomyces sp. NPDC012769 TaxID=3364848 RepID=UPI00367E86F2
MNASGDTGTGTVTYVYAVASPTRSLRERLPALRGIADAAVRLLPDPREGGPDQGPDPLAFVVSHVPREDFDETALKSRFEDLGWLESVARAHHDVVQAVADHATVLPLRMATIYEDDVRARQVLTAQHPDFARHLARLHAHTEYGVKISVPPESAADAAAEDTTAADTTTADATTPLSPGKAYLRRRRARHHARESVYGQAQRAAATVEEIAARFTSYRVRHAPQRGTLAGPDENVVNDSYLVPDDRAEHFRAALAEAAERFPGIRIDVTGPWAPYSFATPSADSDRPAADAGHEP